MSREKLAKIVGMLGSAHDGEIANAARMIQAMAKQANQSIADFLMGTGGPQIVYRDKIVEKPVYRECAECARRAADPEDLRNYKKPDDKFDFSKLRRPRKPSTGPTELLKGLRDAQDYPEHLSGWEMEFVEDMLRKFTFDYEMTDRQAKAARKIIAKIAAAEGEPLV